MLNFKLWIENIFDDDFDKSAWLEKIKSRGNVVKKELKTEDIILPVYHGFNTNPEDFNYIFDSSKSEQNLLWFTHKYIRGYDPITYASNKGKYLLTYPLKVKKITELITYQNGEQTTRCPENIKVNSFENSKYLQSLDFIIELPINWIFSYKHEKFIAFNGKLKTNSSMISVP